MEYDKNIMSIELLCDKIQLDQRIKNKVIDFSKTFDFKSIENIIEDFKKYNKMDEALYKLQLFLKEDYDGIKILSCMLNASVDIYDMYKIRGISDDVYFETMKCYSRFINETFKLTGKLIFDRYWWTTRQAGGHLFRIGSLEYDIVLKNGINSIEIHIPSDADLSPFSVNYSISSAKEFFKRHYPELGKLKFYCCSWIMDRQLQKMLKKDSNIIQFQNLFEIIDVGKASNDFMGWIFNNITNDYSKLEENTSLQKNIKNHLLSGGVIRNSCGRLIDTNEE